VNTNAPISLGKTQQRGLGRIDRQKLSNSGEKSKRFNIGHLIFCGIMPVIFHGTILNPAELKSMCEGRFFELD
jgi:hypothetical protein